MKIIRGKVPSAKRVVIYGPEGIGKSTFASMFPDPVFIDTEGSTKEMDVARFETPSSWVMLMEQINYVKRTPGLCRTLVIDTADWAEQMCVEDLCARNGKKGIEDFGYGNGYVYAKEEFGRFLNTLNDVMEAGINVVLTAHAHMKKFEQPDEMGSYDRWELKLGKKTQSQTTPLVKEWADMLLFANYKTFVINVDGQGAQKGKNKVQGGARVMYTSHHPCWDAKNRYGLPEELPFEYSAIRHIIDQAVADTPKSDPAPMDTPSIPPPVQKAEPSDLENIPAVSGESVQQTMDLSAMNTTQDGGQGNEADIWTPNTKIPKALRDLMIENKVSEWDIQGVVAARGYYPSDTPIESYDPEFIQGVLVGAWPQVYGMIREMREKEAIPFN